MAGKGSRPRPPSVPKETWDENWRKTFGGAPQQKVASGGYIKIRVPDHPRADGRGYVMEHIIVAEHHGKAVIGEPAVIHHINGNRRDNRPENLVICQDRAYHSLLHLRERALRACGNAGWRQCYYCRKWAHPGSMTPHAGSYHHRACNNAAFAAYAERRRQARGILSRRVACRHGHLYVDGSFVIRTNGATGRSKRVCIACYEAMKLRQREARQHNPPPKEKTK